MFPREILFSRTSCLIGSPDLPIAIAHYISSIKNKSTKIDICAANQRQPFKSIFLENL